MKKAYLLLILAIFIFSGCKKGQEADLISGFKVTKNGKSWGTSSGGVLLVRDNFVITASKPIKGYDESIRINFNKSDISDLGKVNTFEARFHYILGGDQIIADYIPVAGSPNSLKITQIDTIQKTIEGEFSFVLEQNANYKNPQFENRISLKEGKFKLSYHIF